MAVLSSMAGGVPALRPPVMLAAAPAFVRTAALVRGGQDVKGKRASSDDDPAGSATSGGGAAQPGNAVPGASVQPTGGDGSNASLVWIPIALLAALLVAGLIARRRQTPATVDGPRMSAAVAAPPREAGAAEGAHAGGENPTPIERALGIAPAGAAAGALAGSKPDETAAKEAEDVGWEEPRAPEAVAAEPSAPAVAEPEQDELSGEEPQAAGDMPAAAEPEPTEPPAAETAAPVTAGGAAAGAATTRRVKRRGRPPAVKLATGIAAAGSREVAKRRGRKRRS